MARKQRPNFGILAVKVETGSDTDASAHMHAQKAVRSWYPLLSFYQQEEVSGGVRKNARGVSFSLPCTEMKQIKYNFKNREKSLLET